MSASKRYTNEQAHALAELYVWEAVASIIEGSCAPRSSEGMSAARKILVIVSDQRHRLIREYDAAIAAQGSQRSENRNEGEKP